MILNISKIKTEALLLFCRDLINSYKDSKSNLGLDDLLEEEFKTINSDIYKQLNNLLQDSSFYIKNQNSFRVKAILKSYNFINRSISKSLQKDESFNPSMLLFSLLALWFKELNKEADSKEYIYFILYPYSNVYDKFLLKIKNSDFRNMNIKMIDIAERTIENYENFSL
ncbi:hypothetical protein [Aliarcobacter thereius]|uniref:Uncharacterized protein n=2 Tax=Aliarcobacter thereius TaxID=544718 RepID=A0A1C0B9P3_9BACT|nr:hypothetical protein [Aliarcobacter thereius]OCL92042.1 hypothetical protein AAX25_00767 [Aliarcobacter thereius]OCL94862.1 hypothetical protein AA347_00306 [Aliarcobacter thereius LMG 24486]OCM00309.1 hypothetical protein AAX29_00312 [Aliarcobacter thereius]QBF15264.1 hypothetical protein ATH_0169 [Aliarcobacter thereius LMG 24486]TLS92003.1 hypothetical protein FE244_07710 [Aliarcobacter thereius]